MWTLVRILTITKVTPMIMLDDTWKKSLLYIYPAKLGTFHFLGFLSANKRETSFVEAPIPPLRPFCASLWLGSEHIMGVRGVKSFVVVIMGSPLQSNHELLKTTLSSAPQQCQLTSMFLWETAGKRPTTHKLQWARIGSVFVCMCGRCIHASYFCVHAKM